MRRSRIASTAGVVINLNKALIHRTHRKKDRDEADVVNADLISQTRRCQNSFAAMSRVLYGLQKVL